MATPEKKVKAQVRKLIAAHGCWYFMPQMGGFGRAGVPDFIGVHCGVFFAVETKAAGGKTTRLQDIEMANITEAGGVCFVVEGLDNTRELELWLTNGLTKRQSLNALIETLS